MSAYKTNTANRCRVPESIAAPDDLDEILGQLAQHNSLMSAREVGQVLGLGRTAVYALIKSGEFGTVNVGPRCRTIRVLRSSLEVYLRRRVRQGRSQPVPVPAAEAPRAASPATPHGAPRRTARRVAR
jgi:excisionase family DNA binding protein